MFLYMSLPHNYCAFLPDQQYHPHKHCIIISEALFLKAFFFPCQLFRNPDPAPYYFQNDRFWGENSERTWIFATFMNQTSVEWKKHDVFGMHSSAKLFILTITISIIAVLRNVSQVWNIKWHGEEDISCKVQLLPYRMLTIKGQYCPEYKMSNRR
jgi:hypothetical protein